MTIDNFEHYHNEYGSEVLEVAKNYLEQDKFAYDYFLSFGIKEFHGALYQLILKDLQDEEKTKRNLLGFFSSILVFCRTKEDYELIIIFIRDLYRLVTINNKTIKSIVFESDLKYIFRAVAIHLREFKVVEV